MDCAWKRHPYVAEDVKYTTFVFNFYVRCLPTCWPNYTLLPKVTFLYCCFLLSSSNIFRTSILEYMYVMVSISSIEKDFIVTIFARKIECKMYIKFKYRKVPRRASRSFVQKWLLCKKRVRYNICSMICGQNWWKIFLKQLSSGIGTFITVFLDSLFIFLTVTFHLS